MQQKTENMIQKNKQKINKTPLIKYQLEKACDYIQQCQTASGGIYWFANDKLDPWDHTEAMIGLVIGGRTVQASNALDWLSKNQNSDGSWFAQYKHIENSDTPVSSKIEMNFVAYPATGLWYFYLATGDKAILDKYFPTVEAAIDYVLRFQSNEGDIQWAVDEDETLPDDSLVTACSSILKSLECALLCAQALRVDKPEWLIAAQKLAHALRHKPHRFDRTWEPKTRFSMDWFYPILSGIYSKNESLNRIEKKWETFFKDGWGCRCVSDQPWVTIAESCELTLALIVAGESEKAYHLHSLLYRWQDIQTNHTFLGTKLPGGTLTQDGGFFTGYNFENDVIWPIEKTSWTNGAVLLAADALFKITPASSTFLTSKMSAITEKYALSVNQST